MLCHFFFFCEVVSKKMRSYETNEVLCVLAFVRNMRRFRNERIIVLWMIRAIAMVTQESCSFTGKPWANYVIFTPTSYIGMSLLHIPPRPWLPCRIMKTVSVAFSLGLKHMEQFCGTVIALISQWYDEDQFIACSNWVKSNHSITENKKNKENDCMRSTLSWGEHMHRIKNDSLWQSWMSF